MLTIPGTARDARNELRSVVTEVRSLDRRLTVLETRFDSLARQTAAEARAAAQSAAALVVAGELRSIGERIVRLKAVVIDAPRGAPLPPP